MTGTGFVGGTGRPADQRLHEVRILVLATVRPRRVRVHRTAPPGPGSSRKDTSAADLIAVVSVTTRGRPVAAPKQLASACTVARHTGVGDGRRRAWWCARTWHRPLGPVDAPASALRSPSDTKCPRADPQSAKSPMWMPPRVLVPTNGAWPGRQVVAAGEVASTSSQERCLGRLEAGSGPSVIGGARAPSRAGRAWPLNGRHAGGHH